MRRLWTLFMLPAFGLVLMAIGPSASANTAVHHASTGARALAAARSYLSHLKIGMHMPNQPAGRHSPRTGKLSQFNSFNWSGYADDNSGGNSYSSVTGKWKEPAITCSSQEDQIAVFWVGIDGFSSNTVEQDGTLAQCFLGVAHYYTWWEMFPTNSITVVGSTVAPADAIAASVVKSGTSYTLKVTDSTHTANSFTTTQTCAATTCVDSSAEWIAEAPSGPRGEYPLPDFHIWNLTSATVKSGATTGHISTFPDDEITMVDSTQTYALSQPGALNSAGNGFKVTWKNSY